MCVIFLGFYNIMYTIIIFISTDEETGTYPRIRNYENL